MDAPGIESRWVRDFPHPFIPAPNRGVRGVALTTHPNMVKVKVSRDRPRWPNGLRSVRAPDFLDFRHYEGGKVVTLTHRPSLPPGVFFPNIVPKLKKVELYVCSIFGPSWPGLGRTSPFIFIPTGAAQLVSLPTPFSVF